jgi:hypothetical protein
MGRYIGDGELIACSPKRRDSRRFNHRQQPVGSVFISTSMTYSLR